MMDKNYFRLFVHMKMLLALLFMLSICFTGQEVILEGLIEVGEEDHEYKPVTVNLVVDKVVRNKSVSEYYRIINEGKGLELLREVDKQVRVTGALGRKIGKDRALNVIDFSVIDPEKEKADESPEPAVEDESSDLFESDG